MALFQATDAALARGLDAGVDAGQSFVDTQVRSYQDPAWVYGMATVGTLVALALVAFLVFAITIYRCKRSKEKQCRPRGLGWGFSFIALAVIAFVVSIVLHVVRNPKASAQLFGAEATGFALGQIF